MTTEIEMTKPHAGGQERWGHLPRAAQGDDPGIEWAINGPLG